MKLWQLLWNGDNPDIWQDTESVNLTSTKDDRNFNFRSSHNAFLQRHFSVCWAYLVWLLSLVQNSTQVTQHIYSHVKKCWHTLFDLGGKWLLSPNAMLIRVMLSEALPDPPTLIDWWGQWRITIKARVSAFYWTMSCPFLYFSGKHGNSYNELHQVCRLFFPWL